MTPKSTSLAIHGGQPLRTKPWIDNLTVGAEERAAVAAVIDSGYLSLFEGSHTPDPPFRFDGGPRVRALEELFRQRHKVEHAISVNSATSGLIMAVGALGLGFGDEVIVSPYTMSACAMAPLIYGAIPVFADVELTTGSLSAEAVAGAITPRTRAILVVHQFGIPADMDGILDIARRHDLKIIEDCAQAWGASHRGRPVGTIGDIGVYSFNVNKTIQSGEGGLCTTRDAELAYRLQLLRNHAESVVGPAEYPNLTNMVGFNFRMTELQAAVACEQLRKLDALNEKRTELVDYLTQGIKSVAGFEPPPGRAECHSTYYIYPLRYLSERFRDVPRAEMIRAINAEGILFYQGYTRPLYRLPLFQRREAFKNGYPWSAPENREGHVSYAPGLCPNAETLYFQQMVINEHIRPPQRREDIDDIIAAIHKVTNGWER
ncbi:MAG: DegT/DnrJ/EryC1/StrS family aminotransferase [Magnetococcales bacterium]|nr:DegT/DnrJ/EryC1/StrS family aminotransferase [Magnetococcales bacterium]MBF0156154.1 DegT/DnrJ/EryC1/StrS family aminotransferase [Magnetococcales bacterium]